MIDLRDLARRTEDSYQWWRYHRDEASDIENKLALQKRAIDDLYDLFSHYLEKLADLEGLPPGALGRRLWLAKGMEFSGSLQRFG